MDETAGSITIQDETKLCANCGTARVGPWCHECGQHEDMTHRSIRKLAVEAFEHLINTDGKIIRTVKALLLRPAALTRGYLDGHRIAQLPPINLFLVILVVFLFCAGGTVNFGMATPNAAQLATIPPYMRWVVPIGEIIHQHQASFLRNLGESAELFGLFTVPVAALLLWGLFAWPRRGFRLYDHLIFALHSLSFQFVIVGIIVALPDALGFLTLPLVVAMAVHLLFHMRGVYGGGAGSTLLRMALLAFGTMFAFIALLAAWMAVAYAAIWV